LALPSNSWFLPIICDSSLTLLSKAALLSFTFLFYFFLIEKNIYLLFICAYNVCVISPPFPNSLPHSPTPLFPDRNYFALISNFVEGRV
jgi:hypothetical protein